MKLLLPLVFSAFLAGCATSSYTVGAPINVENVAKIEHGKTTTENLIAMFGQPIAKSPLSATQEKWVYTYANGSATAQSYVVTMKVESQGHQQTLDLIIENGLVINHTFTDGPIQTMKVN